MAAIAVMVVLSVLFICLAVSDYYCRVILTKDEFEEIKSKCEFAVELHQNGGRSVSDAVYAVAKMGKRKWSHWDIKKLRERVEGDNTNENSEDS